MPSTPNEAEQDVRDALRLIEGVIAYAERAGNDDVRRAAATARVALQKALDQERIWTPDAWHVG